MKLFSKKKDKKVTAVTLNPYSSYVAGDFSASQTWQQECTTFEMRIKKLVTSFGAGLDEYNGAFADASIEAAAKVEKDKLTMQRSDHDQANLEIEMGILSEKRRLLVQKDINNLLLQQLCSTVMLAPNVAPPSIANDESSRTTSIVGNEAKIVVPCVAQSTVSNKAQSTGIDETSNTASNEVPSAVDPAAPSTVTDEVPSVLPLANIEAIPPTANEEVSNEYIA